jgi:hypothetical protein
MPVPGFSPIPPPEPISATQAVEMVIQWFKSSACTEADVCAWLTEQVRQRMLK